MKVATKVLFWVFQRSVHDFVEVVKERLKCKSLGELVKFCRGLPKFARVGVVFGRVFAVAINQGANPPLGHSCAWHIDDIEVHGIRVSFWLTSFSKEAWEELPEERRFEI